MVRASASLNFNFGKTASHNRLPRRRLAQDHQFVHGLLATYSGTESVARRPGPHESDTKTGQNGRHRTAPRLADADGRTVGPRRSGLEGLDSRGLRQEEQRECGVPHAVGDPRRHFGDGNRTDSASVSLLFRTSSSRRGRQRDAMPP